MSDSESILSVLVKFGLIDSQNADIALQKLQEMEDSKKKSISTTKDVISESQKYQTKIEEMSDRNREATETVDELSESEKKLAEEMGVVKVTYTEVAEALKNTSSSSDELKEKTDSEKDSLDDTSASVGNARLEHMALHHAFTELNKVSPGLGTSMMFLSRGFHEAGESAKVASGEVSRLSQTIQSVGFLTVIMLAVQAATTYWDLYQEKLKEVQEEQAKFAKDTQENTAKLIKSMQELDAAMHPKKKDVATKDEDELKQKKQSIEDAHAENSARNKKAESDALSREKKDEDSLLASASSQEQKDGIKQIFSEREEATKSYYKNLKEKNEQSKLDELAAADKAMQAKMNQQTAGIYVKADAIAHSKAEREAYAEETATDDFSIKAQKKVDELRKSIHISDWESADEIEKTIHKHQAEGGKKLKGIVDTVSAMTTESVGIAEKREGVDTELGTDAHKASETKRINDISSGRNPNQASIDAVARQLEAGWAALHRMMAESHDVSNKNIGALITAMADQKSQNLALAARLKYLEEHHGQ